jgi:hypothetical protein
MVVGARSRAKDVDELLRSAPSRRAFFRGLGITFVAGAPVLLAACGGGNDKGAARPSAGPPDADVLNTMLDLEYAAATAYRVSIPALRGESRRTAAQFVVQEQAHAAALAGAIRRLGATPTRPKANYGFSAPPTEPAAFTFLAMLENTTIAAYLDALTKLSGRELRATTMAILTTEAEHVAVLRSLQARNPNPTAFVTGQQP